MPPSEQVYSMVEESTGTARLTCLRCGFEAPMGDAWHAVEHPPLGTLTQCPECGSTDIHSHE